jgi:hypothetical protein
MQSGTIQMIIPMGDNKKHLDGQQTKRDIILQDFPPEFIERNKHSFLFNGVIEALISGIHPYKIIQELLEHIAGA